MDAGDMATTRTPSGRHPAGEYALGQVAPVRQPAPPAKSPFAQLAAETSALEHLIREALVEQERRLMLRIETAGKAEESAALTMARRSAKRRGAWAMTLGAALGTASVVFATAWQTYRNTREIAVQAATETADTVVAEKAAPIEVKSTVTDVRIAAVEERQSVVEGKLDAVLEGLTALRTELQPATKVRVRSPR